MQRGTKIEDLKIDYGESRGSKVRSQVRMSIVAALSGLKSILIRHSDQRDGVFLRLSRERGRYVAGAVRVQ